MKLLLNDDFFCLEFETVISYLSAAQTSPSCFTRKYAHSSNSRDLIASAVTNCSLVNISRKCSQRAYIRVSLSGACLEKVDTNSAIKTLRLPAARSRVSIDYLNMDQAVRFSISRSMTIHWSDRVTSGENWFPSLVSCKNSSSFAMLRIRMPRCGDVMYRASYASASWR